MAADQRPPPAPIRLEWLDLYRGTAVLVMIEVHVFNAFLAADVRAMGWFATLNYINGLVAPAFLFIAGYAHGLGLRRAQTHRTGLLRRLRRLGIIAAIGFFLEFPWAHFIAGEWTEVLRVGSRVNILPCLATSIAVLALVEHWAGRWVKVVVGMLSAIVLIVAPLASGWTHAPVPVLAWLNQTTESLFPLLPWAAFAWMGFLLSSRPLRRGMLAVGLAAALAGLFVLGRAHLTPVSAAFFLERLAWVLALVFVVLAVEVKWSPRAVVFAGQESLVMYVAHLVIIGAVMGAGVSSLRLVSTAGLYALVLAGSFAATWTWRRLMIRSEMR